MIWECRAWRVIGGSRLSDNAAIWARTCGCPVDAAGSKTRTMQTN
jgi:hypothetical protein